MSNSDQNIQIFLNPQNFLKSIVSKFPMISILLKIKRQKPLSTSLTLYIKWLSNTKRTLLQHWSRKMIKNWRSLIQKKIILFWVYIFCALFSLCPCECCVVIKTRLFTPLLLVLASWCVFSHCLPLYFFFHSLVYTS